MTAVRRRRGPVLTALLAAGAATAVLVATAPESPTEPPVVALAAAALPANCTQAAPAAVVSCRYSYTGDVQSLDVPAGATRLQVLAIGGRGGRGGETDGDYPEAFNDERKAARVDAPLPDSAAGQRLFVVVGGDGGSHDTPAAGVGGFNGGGQARPTRPTTVPPGFSRPEGGGGGGASDVRTVAPGASGSLESRLVVAGGGGGDSQAVANLTVGGNAGGSGYGYFSGAPGTAASGGRGGLANYESSNPATPYDGPPAPENDGGLGRGGDGVGHAVSETRPFYGGGGGGGGGGLYGGGGGLALGANYSGGAGGGSSLVPAGGTGPALTLDGPVVVVTYQPSSTAAAIRLDPQSSTVQAGSPQTYTVTDVGADGSTIGPRSEPTTLAIAPDGTCTGLTCTPAAAGAHTVTATSSAFTDTATLTATPAPVVASTVTATGGQGQSTRQGTAFPSPLQATVATSTGAAVPNVPVTFSVASGSATFPGNATSTTATTDAQGVATSPTLTAGSAGPVVVNATTAGVSTPATFTATVTSPPPATATTVTATSGNNQTATAGSAFAQPLVARVTGAGGLPIPAATTTFTISGPATFPGGATTATATTDADGRATSPTLTAGTTAGAVTVKATSGQATPATFTETVQAATPPPSANRADLGVSLTAPTSVRAGQTAPVTVTVTDAGPADATQVATGLTTANGLKIVSAPNGIVSRDGRSVAFVAATIKAGKSVTYTLTVRAEPASAGAQRIDAGTTSRTPDPRYANNAATRTVTVTR